MHNDPSSTSSNRFRNENSLPTNIDRLQKLERSVLNFINEEIDPSEVVLRLKDLATAARNVPFYSFSVVASKIEKDVEKIRGVRSIRKEDLPWIKAEKLSASLLPILSNIVPTKDLPKKLYRASELAAAFDLETHTELSLALEREAERLTAPNANPKRVSNIQIDIGVRVNTIGGVYGSPKAVIWNGNSPKSAEVDYHSILSSRILLFPNTVFAQISFADRKKERQKILLRLLDSKGQKYPVGNVDTVKLSHRRPLSHLFAKRSAREIGRRLSETT